ncbi:DUF4405 domain-containing protein [Adlercreutzia sp. R25]|uniref:DUF4405 domain-containing protein n=1 Tax=Adlercreutzia shanghongiae TaxID=3111773 RepID=UPI002DBF34F5|nr:DUF4405 domain-containing protein [Adlercreutzia sp. R25]MEC4271755.1 DUF4405 domain-containing protein [Adlercreutzia sp. R25]
MKRSHVLFDVVVLVAYVAAANPVVTGIPLHEFVGLLVVVLVAAHVVASADGLLARGRKGGVARMALNAVLLLSLGTCAVSGVMVSGDVLPALGLYATGYHFWDPLHAFAAKVLLAAIIVHVVVRAPAALAVLRRGASLSGDLDACDEREPVEA